MAQEQQTGGFELGISFDKVKVSGGIELGPYAAHYGELFADALEDGVITAEERERLDKAAENLGMNRMQLQQLEQAMVNAYEMHHRVKVIERWEAPPASLQPIQVDSKGDGNSAMLLAQIEKLNRRITELESELREARSNVNVEVDLTGLNPAENTVDESPEQLRARIRRDPVNPKLFARLYRACGESGDKDGQYRAAQALVVLGAADTAQTQLAELHTPKGLIAPQRALSSEEWATALSHPELEVVTSSILGLLAPAALMGRVAGLRREKKLLQPPESQKQNPAESTLMAVRALAWAATVLGMPTPPVYTDVGRDVGFAHVPGVPPFTLVGKAALSGKTQLENAFLAARHVTHYRSEFFVKVLFPGVSELEDLFLAALLIGSPNLPIATHLRSRVTPISEALGPMLDGPRRDSLRQQFKAFVADGGRTNLLRWTQSVDKTACRAGLLLSGDLASAARLLALEEGPKGPLFADLLGFLVSDRYTQLRKRLGIEVS